MIEKFNNDIESLQLIKKQIFELRKIYDKVKNDTIKLNLKKIIVVSDKIYKELVLNTNKLGKVKNFANYYIVTIQKVMSKYCLFEEKGIQTTEKKELQNNIEIFLPKVNDAFEKMYQSLFDDEILDVDSEIQVMLKQLKI